MTQPDAQSIEPCRGLLTAVSGKALSSEELAQRALELAQGLFALAEAEKRPSHHERARLLSRMMADRQGQAFTTLLTDRAHRSISPETTVSQAVHLLGTLGTPRYLPWFERLQLGLLRTLGPLVPNLATTKLRERIHQEAARYIRSSAPEQLANYLAERAREGVRVNLNHLGEEVLGEAEAGRRVTDYVALLERDDVRSISVKVSSIFSQADPLGFASALSRVADRLRTIYRAALHRASAGAPKFVYLDMEAYRDVELTLAAFRKVLDEPEFRSLSAGCVLQAYLPDALGLQAELLAWAKARVATGGSPIRTRIVKGANLAVERIESALRGWALPIYPSKVEVDANFKRMVLVATQPEHAAVAQVGIASHNVFDIAWALLASASSGSEANVGFELLEGMAEHLWPVLRRLERDVLLYTPIVDDGSFPSAIAYLVRRLDENTSEQNFLRHSFDMQVGDEAWQAQRAAFVTACQHIAAVSSARRRVATLPLVMQEAATPPRAGLELGRFENEPDTDFSLPENRSCLEHALRTELSAQHEPVRSEVPGVDASTASMDGFDPSRPGHVPYRIELLPREAIDKALDNGARAGAAWARSTPQERARLLLGCAAALRRHRAELIALMVGDAGKRADEADVEVSEAIDFAEYYARSALQLASDVEDAGIALGPRGLVVVTPPWNFPLAIPLGGAFAALVMGNSVILKPALETPRVARRALELCWSAGVPREVLQLVVCEDEAGSLLITDPRVASVILTGASSTARLFRELRSDLLLFAETGGKNALIVMPLADRELSIADVLASAFGHAGQKCSAASLLVLHRELYDDPGFLETLRDAAASLEVGSAWDAASRVTPLIQPPSPLQRRALTELEPGESWLLEPRIDRDNPRLVSPGIKLGVARGSYSHLTEFFCPLLSVLRAEDLDDAIGLVNATAYGLTSGLHSLDERDQARWVDRIRAGNLYVNRRITGAVVQRQPFGGWKESSFGAGAKAGGPNYVTQFAVATAVRQAPPVDTPVPARLARTLARLEKELARSMGEAGHAFFATLERVARRYQRDFELHFRDARDVSGVPGQDNLLRYVPASLVVCLMPPDPADMEPCLQCLAWTMLAGWVVGAEVPVLAQAGLTEQPILRALQTVVDVEPFTGPDAVRGRLRELSPERVLVLGGAESLASTLNREAAWYVTNREPVGSGRLDLLLHLREQALSVNFHRYGHLGLRAGPALLSTARAD